MTLDAYPDEAEIVETNFKTDQQADAAETIAEEWPVDLDRLAEEGQHVKMFYKQVLDQFLGPAEVDATFADLKDEYGSLEQWADSDDEADESDDEEDDEAPDIENIEPGAGTEADTDESMEETMTIDVDAAANEAVDDRRRAWFRAGFREGVEFALKNPELFRQD